MWTIGFQPNGCASPVLLRKDGEMLAFAHIPTRNHNNQEGFILNPAVGDCMFGPDRRNSKRWTHFSQRFRVTLRVNNHR
jgi:hypothetical protein